MVVDYLQQQLVKNGRTFDRAPATTWLPLAESHLTRRLFDSMLRRIATLPSPAG
jgi:hypothetical protein